MLKDFTIRILSRKRKKLKMNQIWFVRTPTCTRQTNKKKKKRNCTTYKQKNKNITKRLQPGDEDYEQTTTNIFIQQLIKP